MTDTIYHYPSDGSRIVRGKSVVANGGTISTKLTEASGFVGKCESADTVVSVSLSAGTATVTLKTAGADATGNHTVDWVAWCDKKT